MQMPLRALSRRAVVVAAMLAASCAHTVLRADVAIYKAKSLIPPGCTELTAITAFDGYISERPDHRMGDEARALRKLQEAAVVAGGNALFLDTDATEEEIVLALPGSELHLHGMAIKCAAAVVAPQAGGFLPTQLAPNKSLERTRDG